MATKKELVIAQINHQETETIPYQLSIESDVADELDHYFMSDQWRSKIDNAIFGVTIPKPELCVGFKEGEEFHTDIFGAVWRSNGILSHLQDWPLKEPTLDNFKFPEIKDCFDPGWEEQVRKEIEDNAGRFTTSFFGFGLFERSWTLRGFNNALSDMALYPDFYEELINGITEFQLGILDRVLELPIDGIFFSDDWGYQQGVLMGPARWRRFFKANYAKLYDRAHAAGKYTFNHCCGAISDILPDLIEIGLDVYESVQPEANNNNPYDLKKRFGENITFQGCLGAQSMPSYSPEGIRVEIQRLSTEMSRGGGFILAPAKSLPSGVPVEVAAAVVEAFLEQDGIFV
jgi:uroporphyrinogen decarboxylase